MTLLEIKQAVAAYHTMPGSGVVVTTSDLTVNGVDLFLIAANQAKQSAAQVHDFGFQRKLMTLVVNSVTGGNLSDAVLVGTSTSAVVKTVLEVGWFPPGGVFTPVEWTTAEEGTERQREEHRFHSPRWRYPTDAQYHADCLWGQRRVTFRGDTLALYPVSLDNPMDITFGLDVFIEDVPWVGADVTGDSVSDFWTTSGSQYLLWQCICDLNKYFKTFVGRQEGNVSEPQERASSALAALIDTDVFRFEQNRRHGR